MKTSNKIFTGLLTLLLLLVIGSNLVLKAGYDKINFSDPFYGYALSQAPAFKAVKVLGNLPGSVRLQRGKGFEVRALANQEQNLKWRLTGDTLVIEYTQPESSELSLLPKQIHPEQAFRYPLVYVVAPTLQSVQSQSTLVLSDWQEPEMRVEVTGQYLILDQNKLIHLSLTTGQSSSAEIRPTNLIETATVTLQDSSTLQVKKDVFGSILFQASPQASVNVPVSVLQKLALGQGQP